MKRLTDLQTYTGVLPYSSELFGVYQPLIGWTSARQRARLERGFANDLEQARRGLLFVLQAIATSGPGHIVDDRLDVVEGAWKAPDLYRHVTATHVTPAHLEKVVRTAAKPNFVLQQRVSDGYNTPYIADHNSASSPSSGGGWTTCSWWAAPRRPSAPGTSPPTVLGSRGRDAAARSARTGAHAGVLGRRRPERSAVGR